MKRSTSRERTPGGQRWRHWLVLGALGACGMALLARAVYLQVIDQEFLEKQGDARILRVAKLSANRGMIVDRNGEALAVSTPSPRSRRTFRASRKPSTAIRSGSPVA